MGADVEFTGVYPKLSKRKEEFVHFISHLKVKTSARRFNKMSWWKNWYEKNAR
jgi:hypothetical protein